MHYLRFASTEIIPKIEEVASKSLILLFASEQCQLIAIADNQLPFDTSLQNNFAHLIIFRIGGHVCQVYLTHDCFLMNLKTPCVIKLVLFRELRTSALLMYLFNLKGK